MVTDTAPLTDQQHADGWPHARHLRSRIFVILSENIHAGRVSVVTDEVVGLVQPELDRLATEIDRLRARVDTLTAVAQSNAKAQRVAYEECERLRAEQLDPGKAVLLRALWRRQLSDAQHSRVRMADLDRKLSQLRAAGRPPAPRTPAR